MYDIDKLSRDIYEAISGDIQKKFRDHYNMVIVGNNSTGKTSLIECLLNTVKQQKRKDFYYIDPKNRTVYEPEEEGGYSLDLESITAYDIISSRIHKKVMAKKDIFVDNLSGGGFFFTELVTKFDVYRNVLEQFMGWEINVESPEETSESIFERAIERNQRKKVIINNSYEIASISSSEQAKMRIVMEVMIAKEKDCKVVIIDEFDSHFDSEGMVSFLAQLVKKFNEIRFIVIIHNYEVLVNINDFDALIFNILDTSETPYNYVDTNDISQIGDAYKVFNRFAGKKGKREMLLREGITYVVKDEKIPIEIHDEIAKIDRKLLTNKEKILFDYIKEKNGE